MISRPIQQAPGGLTVIILGGYGAFGGRIAELLADQPKLTLVVAGRSIEKARARVESLGKAQARLVPAAIDRDGIGAAELAALRPDILIDASGPFQAYGEPRYRIAEACISQGVHYLDLADSAAFAAGIGAFDAAARAAGVAVLSGVSTFPALTAAAVRRLAEGMAQVETISAGIAPSPHAGVGGNVIRAIASYAGRAIQLRRDGGARSAHALTEQRRFTIAPPGCMPLRSTLFSLIDVPDPGALPELWPEVKSIWNGAGPVPEYLHRLLIALAWLTRFRIVLTLAPAAPLMHAAMNLLRRGEHRGGMFVEVTGRDAQGAPVKRSWHLVAEGDGGPFIPAMGVAALVLSALDGKLPAPGARAAIRELELSDYERLFARRPIHTGIRDDSACLAQPVYQRVLGAAFDALPLEIRAMHLIKGTASGRARVDRGAGVLARLAALIMGFPQAADDTPVRVTFDCAGGIETWTRNFGGKKFSSRQFAGTGRSERLLCEQFGPLTFAMALVPGNSGLALELRRWSIFGMPLPMALCPRTRASESAEAGRFHFDVEISHPLAGLIVRYRGWLKPD